MNHTSVINMHGVKAVDFNTTLKAADLDWDPQEDTVSGTDTAIVMPRKKLLYRSDNRQALGIVGEGYSPSDPREFLRAQFEFADFCKGKVTQAGFLGDRSRAFAFINLCDVSIPRGKSQVGDPLSVYIYSTDGWDGGTPRQSRLYIERLVCKNGMSHRKLAANLWVSHTKGMEATYNNRWKKYMGEIRHHVDAFVAEFTRLASERMSKEQMNEFLAKLIPGESTMSENRRQEINRLFNEGEGNTGATRWDAYNAVTEYVTHHRSYRGNQATSVETNRFLGVLETDTLAESALALLN